MQIIKLNNQEWQVDTSSRLGPPGGFGEVFRGKGKDGEVAIKRLMLTASQAAHRELQIGESLSKRKFNHVVPILDSGRDADSDRYFLVMPVCEMSLQDAINAKGRFSAKEAMAIMLAILSGLAEVQDITHRDLKPPNVLLHEGVWKVADFGIAKFVEDSTSLETLRGNLTPAYAAPEQWQLQRPTAATDIYALGCIAHALITGKPPFVGDMDAIREQHLNKVPAPLEQLPAGARSLVSLMLRKVPETRPSRERCIEVLKKALEADSQEIRKVDSQMAEAVNVVAQEQAKREVERKAREERKRKRDAIFNEAVRELRRIKDRLFSEIENHARGVMTKDGHHGTRISVGYATLVFDTALGVKKSDAEEMGGDSGWGVNKRRSSWDLMAFTHISIEQRVGILEYRRCANIVFGRPDEKSDYRWFEMAFWSMDQNIRHRGEPFCMEYAWEIDEVLAPVMDLNNLAYPPKPIDGEDEDAFIEYWIDLFAQAMVGRLRRPNQMPMKR